MRRMKHPQHGFGFAHNTAEEKSMTDNGWTDDDAVEDQPKEVKRRTKKEAIIPDEGGDAGNQEADEPNILNDGE